MAAKTRQRIQFFFQRNRIFCSRKKEKKPEKRKREREKNIRRLSGGEFGRRHVDIFDCQRPDATNAAAVADRQTNDSRPRLNVADVNRCQKKKQTKKSNYESTMIKACFEQVLFFMIIYHSLSFD